MAAPTNSTQGYVEVEGGQLAYEVAGEGHPLLLIHAGIADMSMWDEQFREFAGQYRVIRYDTRGYGKSKTEDVEFSNRQDAYTLLTHLGVDKAYVMGVSRGGQIALDFTLEHPELVDALLLVASGLGGFDSPPPTEAEMALFDQEERLWEAKDWEGLADLSVRLWVDGPGQPEGRADKAVREKVRRMCLNNSTTHEHQGKPIVLDPPAAGRLTEVAVPTLVIVGDLDESPTVAACHALGNGIEGARMVMMEGVAHLPMMERPQEFNRIVSAFLGSL